MTTAAITLVVEGVTAAIKAAPQIKAVISSAKDWVTSLFSAGLIDAATQARIHTHVDEVAMSALANTEGPEWNVEPDPE